MATVQAILVVVDNVDAAETLSCILDPEGFEVKAAFSGEAGLSLARQQHFDAAILDLTMPGLDGYSLARELRSLSPSTVLFALCGHALPMHQERSRAAGFARHFSKPADAESIVRALRGQCADGEL